MPPAVGEVAPQPQVFLGYLLHNGRRSRKKIAKGPGSGIKSGGSKCRRGINTTDRSKNINSINPILLQQSHEILSTPVLCQCRVCFFYRQDALVNGRAMISDQDFGGF